MDYVLSRRDKGARSFRQFRLLAAYESVKWLTRLSTVKAYLVSRCALGLAAEVLVHATRCVVRNNFITRAHENGIVADYTRDYQIVHNTILE